MNKKIAQLILLLILFLMVNAMSISSVEAGTKIVQLGPIQGGLTNTGTTAGYPITNGVPNKEFAAAWIGYINNMMILMGLLFLILTIYGGWLWMTAHGNDEQVNKGKKIIIGAALGLTIILGARIIVEFTISSIPTSL